MSRHAVVLAVLLLAGLPSLASEPGQERVDANAIADALLGCCSHG